MKKIIFIFLLICISIFGETDYIAKIVTDGEGNILEEENIDIKHPVASITKMVTALVAFDKIEKGEISLTDEIVVSRKAATIGGSSIRLRRGDRISLEDLLKGLIVRSGNDAAVAVAEHIAGTEDDFVKLMNEKASDLGLKNTVFHTSTGLPESMTKKPLDMSTARDVAKLSIEVLKYHEYIDWASQKTIMIKEPKVKFNNWNKLVGSYEGVDGLKTGHHDAAQYNISVSAKRGDIRLIVILLGAPSEKERDNEVRSILDDGFAKYEKIKVAEKGVFALQLPIKDAKKKEIELVLEKDVFAVIDKTKNYKFYKTAYVPKELKAPVNENEKVGVLSIKYKDRVIEEVSLISKESAEKISFFGKVLRVVTFNLF